jgi:hypothetical protein
VRQHDVLIGLSVTSRMRRMTSCAITGVACVSITITASSPIDDAGVGIAFRGVRVRVSDSLSKLTFLANEVGLRRETSSRS